MFVRAVRTAVEDPFAGGADFYPSETIPDYYEDEHDRGLVIKHVEPYVYPHESAGVDDQKEAARAETSSGSAMLPGGDDGGLCFLGTASGR